MLKSKKISSLVALMSVFLLTGQASKAEESFPDRIPNLCASNSNYCSENLKSLIGEYDQLKHVPDGSSSKVYEGRCEVLGSRAMVGGAFALFVIKASTDREVVKASGRFSSPLNDYNGKPLEPMWRGETEEGIFMRASEQLSEDEFAYLNGGDFAYVDTRRENNSKQFVSWFRTTEDESRGVFMGYFSNTTIFVCAMKLYRQP